MQSEQLRNGSPVRLGDLGMMVLQFFGGLVSVPLATILGALVIGLGGLNDEGLALVPMPGQSWHWLGWRGSRSAAVPGCSSWAGSPAQPCIGTLSTNTRKRLFDKYGGIRPVFLAVAVG